MAPWSPHTSDKDSLVQAPDRPTKDTQGFRTVKGETTSTLSVCQKLMLNAQFWAMDASCNFEQLYTVPILQILGMPMALVSLTGIIAGPSALLLLPLVGWITDRGSNPRRRKIIATLFAACLILLGMGLLVVANTLHLMYLMNYDYNLQPGNNHSSDRNTSTTTTADLVTLNGGINFYASSMTENGAGAETDSPLYADFPRSSEDIGSIAQVSREVPRNESGLDVADKEATEVPLKAVLGLLAFVLLDIGFDTINGFTKSFVLTCTPRCEHTSVLLVSLVMASAGGVSTAALGVVDFTSLLGLSYIEGGSLCIQTTFQAVEVMVCVVLGFVITLLTGRRLLKHKECLSSLNTDAEVGADNCLQPDDHVPRTSWADALENSVRSYSSAGVYFDPTLTLQDDARGGNSEQTPLLGVDDEMSDPKDDCLSFSASSLSVSYGTHELSHRFNHSEQPGAGRGTLEDVPEDDILVTTKKPDSERTIWGLSSFKAKMACLCFCTYFSMGVTVTFTYTCSDFLGKAVYGGMPDAPPGSEDFARYQQGLRTASWGFLTYFSCYLAVSIVHHRILALLGYRVEFVLSHVLLSICLMTMALTARVEVFFVTAAIASFQRACLYSIPYAVTNDVLQSSAEQTADGKGKEGVTMTVISAMIPLGYSTIYTIIGPLEDWTGMVAAPLWLGATCGCLSSAVFLVLGKV